MSANLVADGFNFYRRKGGAWLRPHVVGEDMSGISVAEPDIARLQEPGGWIAVNQADPTDLWYVNKDWFESNYESTCGWISMDDTGD